MSTLDVVKEKMSEKLKLPPNYKVVFHNDDFTPMEFVMELLQRFFNKSQEVAFQLTMEVHQSGKSVVGVYRKDIAETKVEQASVLSKYMQHPLKITIEPEQQS